MVTYTVNLGLEKYAVASEVISSGARILHAAGFTSTDIADMFRRAAEELETGQVTENQQALASEPLAAALDTFGLYDLLEEYESTAEKKALARLEKRGSNLGRGDSKEELERVFALVEQALPLAEKAQQWMIEKCSSVGIQIEPSKDEWLETATDEQLDAEDRIVFLDDWRINGDFQLDKLELLARCYAHSGDLAAFQALLQLVRDHKIIYGARVLDQIEESTNALESMADFVEFVAGYSGMGELTQSTVLDDYITRSGFAGGTYILEGWLDTLASRGDIQRYKRSNRWRVVV